MLNLSQLARESQEYPLLRKIKSFRDPDIYLGAKLRKVTLDNGVEAWGHSPSKYVQEADRNELGFTIRSGIVVIEKNTTVADGTVI